MGGTLAKHIAIIAALAAPVVVGLLFATGSWESRFTDYLERERRALDSMPAAELIAMLNDRSRALAASAALARRGEEIVPVLKPLVARQGPEGSWAACALAAASPAGLEHLAVLLSCDDMNTRVNARAGLCYGGNRAVALLVPWLRGDPRCRDAIWILNAIAMKSHPGSIEARYYDVAVHWDPWIDELLSAFAKAPLRQEIALLLGNIGDQAQRAVEALIAGTTDEDWLVRRACVVALGKIAVNDPAVLDVLARCLTDTHRAVRLAAVQALGGAPFDERVKAALTMATSDPAAEVRDAAQRASHAKFGK